MKKFFIAGGVLIVAILFGCIVDNSEPVFNVDELHHLAKVAVGTEGKKKTLKN